MRRIALLRGLGATLLAGALLSVGAAARADGKTAPAANTDEAGFDNVEVLDPTLGGHLSVVSVGSQRTNTNLLSIFATLKNLTGHALLIEAETLYKNGNGDWLDGGKASWISLELKPHEEMDYRSASLSDEAQDFLVRIRRPEKSATNDEGTARTSITRCAARPGYRIGSSSPASRSVIPSTTFPSSRACRGI